MNLIAFFGLRIKPVLTRGKGMWNPLNTQVMEDIICIRDKDVNCFLLKADEGYIAIDSGYKNSSNVRNALTQLAISREEIKAVFLTHLDIDHAGGMDFESEVVYPYADIYLGKEEEKYLTGEYCRKKVLFHKCRLPIVLKREIKTLNHMEKIYFGNLSIQAIHAPGHTLGHTAYIVNEKWLFSGDCIIANESGGYSFYDFWNQESQMNKNTLVELKRLCDRQKLKYIMTSHSGRIAVSEAFNHMQEVPQWRRKDFVFCKTAYENPYRES